MYEGIFYLHIPRYDLMQISTICFQKGEMCIGSTRREKSKVGTFDRLNDAALHSKVQCLLLVDWYKVGTSIYRYYIVQVKCA